MASSPEAVAVVWLLWAACSSRGDYYSYITAINRFVIIKHETETDTLLILGHGFCSECV